MLSTTLSAKRPIPTKTPYWTEPEMKAIVVLLTDETLIVKRTAADKKQSVERIHIVMLKPALSFGALNKTNMKFRTPKTTARYKSRIAIISIPAGAPIKPDETRFISEPQLRDKRVFKVKSTKVILTESAYTKGRLIL